MEIEHLTEESSSSKAFRLIKFKSRRSLSINARKLIDMRTRHSPFTSSVTRIVVSTLLVVTIGLKAGSAQEIPSGEDPLYITYEDWPLPAEEEMEEEAWDFSALVGVGLAVRPDYEGSEDYKIGPRPALALRARRGRFLIQTKGIGVQANVVLHPNMHAGLVVRARGRRDDVSNDAVDSLEETDTAVEFGGTLGFNYQGWVAGITVAQDVINAHDGLVVAGNAGYRAGGLSGLSVTTAISTSFASSDYMETYFGIDAENAARSGLPKFDADAGIKDIGLSVRLGYTFAENWAFSLISSYQRLLGDAADSPLVEDEGDANQFFNRVSVIYRF